MRLLITGVTGFIGQSLLTMLNTQCVDIEILTLSRDLDKVEKIFSALKHLNMKHIQTGDMEDVIKFNPEITIHLAAFSSHKNDSSVIEPLISSNINFGVLLLDTLNKCPAMKLFVNTGSFSEYSGTPYLYTASKIAFRSFVNYYSNLSGYRYINAIPYTVYGNDMTVKRVVDYIKESMESKTQIDMTGGQQVLDFISVEDVSSFFANIVSNPEPFYNLKTNGIDFHLGTGVGTSIRDLTRIIERKYNTICNINWGAIPYRNSDIMYSVAPVDKNDPSINWQAEFNLFDKI
jgi:CDP-paratose synthetase